MNLNEKKEPDRIIHVGGMEFRLYKYRDDYDGSLLLDLPNFLENPEYTDEGRPFVLAVQESCPNVKSGDPDYPDPCDCSGCVWLYLEGQADAIGICMCDELKREYKE